MSGVVVVVRRVESSYICSYYVVPVARSTCITCNDFLLDVYQSDVLLDSVDLDLPVRTVDLQ